MKSTSFCSECECVAGNGQRGAHLIYAAMLNGPSEPMTCAFCSHTSMPVSEEEAFKPVVAPRATEAQLRLAWKRNGNTQRITLAACQLALDAILNAVDKESFMTVVGLAYDHQDSLCRDGFTVILDKIKGETT